MVAKNIHIQLDRNYGSCIFRRDELAEIMKSALQFFDGTRYALHAWAIMPNHVHAVFDCFPGFAISKIMHSWKSYTASKINKELDRTGQLWHREYYDRIMKDEDEY
jgi:REP element-mobilizing transposase RayT